MPRDERIRGAARFLENFGEVLRAEQGVNSASERKFTPGGPLFDMWDNSHLWRLCCNALVLMRKEKGGALMGLYNFRPGVSPVVAGLFASGVITREDRILDVGCGTGTDCIALKLWGLTHVVGIDNDERLIETADRRALRHKLNPADLFHLGSITEEHICFERNEFTVVIDSLVLNNIPRRGRPAYVKEVARVLAPGGLLILQLRETRRFSEINAAEDWAALSPVFHKHFTFGSVVTTHIAERPAYRGHRAQATIGVAVGRRRRRAVPI